VETSKIQGEFTELATVPFNSKNKWMASVFKKNTSSVPTLPKLCPRFSIISVAESIAALAEPNYGDCFDLDEKHKCVVVVKGRLCGFCLFHVGHLGSSDEIFRRPGHFDG